MRTILQCRHRFASNSKPLNVYAGFARLPALLFRYTSIWCVVSCALNVLIHSTDFFCQPEHSVLRFFFHFAHQQFRIFPNLNRHAPHATNRFLFFSLCQSLCLLLPFHHWHSIPAWFSLYYYLRINWFGFPLRFFAVHDTSYGHSWFHRTNAIDWNLIQKYFLFTQRRRFAANQNMSVSRQIPIRWRSQSRTTQHVNGRQATHYRRRNHLKFDTIYLLFIFR